MFRSSSNALRASLKTVSSRSVQARRCVTLDATKAQVQDGVPAVCSLFPCYLFASGQFDGGDVVVAVVCEGGDSGNFFFLLGKATNWRCEGLIGNWRQ